MKIIKYFHMSPKGGRNWKKKIILFLVRIIVRILYIFLWSKDY